MKNAYLYIIIFLEGYVVLATELLAMRQLIPFVGSGTETVAIIIAAVLMPLAFGYYFGGKYKPTLKNGKLVTIREKLIRNILNAAVFLVIGLSYVFLAVFFSILQKLGITHRIFQASLYSILFLIFPIYLLGQTVPLVSNFFMKENLSHLTGKILFFSTVGSFMGATISTIILMSIIGVNNTLIANIIILSAVVFILSKKVLNINNAIMLLFLGIVIALNSNSMMQKLSIVENNRYSTISIVKDINDNKIMNINNSMSAKYSANPEQRFSYIKFVEDNFINPLKNSPERKKILVVGAGGFTVGIDDNFNEYTFVDIDSSLKNVSEQYLLPRNLGDNKKFTPQDARAFFNSNQEKFDLIFLDAFTNIYSVPAHLLTIEFFQQVRNHLADGGIMLFNCITSPSFATKYSVKIDNSLRSVFPNINRQILGNINPKDIDKNIIYVYFKRNYADSTYTDDKNTYFLDH